MPFPSLGSVYEGIVLHEGSIDATFLTSTPQTVARIIKPLPLAAGMPIANPTCCILLYTHAIHSLTLHTTCTCMHCVKASSMHPATPGTSAQRVVHRSTCNMDTAPHVRPAARSIPAPTVPRWGPGRAPARPSLVNAAAAASCALTSLPQAARGKGHSHTSHTAPPFPLPHHQSPHAAPRLPTPPRKALPAPPPKFHHHFRFFPPFLPPASSLTLATL